MATIRVNGGPYELWVSVQTAAIVAKMAATAEEADAERTHCEEMLVQAEAMNDRHAIWLYRERIPYFAAFANFRREIDAAVAAFEVAIEGATP